MTTMVIEGPGYSAEFIDRDEDTRFRSSPILPDPSMPYFQRNGIGISELLSSPFADCSVTAILKRIANEGYVDDYVLVNVLACALYSDDPSYSAYNALVLLEHMTKRNIMNGMMESKFASAVAGLSFHNGPAGNVGMHRLSDPQEIAGAAAVVAFIGAMDKSRMVKPSTLHHVNANGRRELTITNRHVDRLLRLNPEALILTQSFLSENKLSAVTRKSVQPLIDYLEGQGLRIKGLEINP